MALILLHHLKRRVSAVSILGVLIRIDQIGGREEIFRLREIMLLPLRGPIDRSIGTSTARGFD
jgi:hypothetical protein